MSPTLRRLTESAFRLGVLLAESEHAQFQPSHTPKPREDTDERSRGGYGDPTASTVIDDARVDLRARVVEAEAMLARATRAVDRAGARLQVALDAWAGSPPSGGK